jgi:hypothetical protein
MTEINYRTQVAAQVEADAAKEKAAANDAAWQEIIDRYVIRDHQANRRMVEDFCNGIIELAKFKFLVDNPPQGFQLDWSTEDALKTELIEKILAARQFSPVEAKSNQSKMKFWTLRMLRNELQRLTMKEHLSSNFTVDELKAGVKEVRESNVPKYAGYENLPRTIVPKGFVTAVSTSEFLRHAARHDIRAFEYYVKRYGSQQVNNFLNNRI